MKILNNKERIVNFFIHRRRDMLTSKFWLEVWRVTKHHLSYLTNGVSASQFKENLINLEKRPLMLCIEVTNICNANCVFCAYQYQTRKKAFMDFAMFKKALDDYCEIGGGELSFTCIVGDPLMDMNFLEKIKEARSRPEITAIGTVTNGILLDKIGVENLLKSGLNRIWISSSPWDETLHEKIYRSGQYKRFRDNVTELLKKNKELGMPVEIEVLFRSNLSMEETLNMPDYAKVKHLPHKSSFNTDFDTWLGTISQQDLLQGMHIRPMPKMDKEACQAISFGPVIYADGKVGLCTCRDYNATTELVVGNIMERSLIDIWNSDKVKKIKESYEKGTPPEVCKKCTTYLNLDTFRTKDGTKMCNELKVRFESSKHNVTHPRSPS